MCVAAHKEWNESGRHFFDLGDKKNGIKKQAEPREHLYFEFSDAHLAARHLWGWWPRVVMKSRIHRREYFLGFEKNKSIRNVNCCGIFSEVLKCFTSRWRLRLKQCFNLPVRTFLDNWQGKTCAVCRTLNSSKLRSLLQPSMHTEITDFWKKRSRSITFVCQELDWDLHFLLFWIFWYFWFLI